MYSELIFYSLLFTVAFLYASVGHGGASGYLALMAFYSFTPLVMRPTALILNVCVSLIAFLKYYQHGFFRWNLFWPFAVASVPASFFGGLITVDDNFYRLLLAVFLLLSVARLFISDPTVKHKLSEPAILVSLTVGAIIGFLSGMIGIGGGIILSPLVLLLHWADLKQTAAVSALFIFVNSLSGLAGTFLGSVSLSNEIITMAAAAIGGGWLGSAFGSGKFKSAVLRYILSAVLIIAAVKLLAT